MVNTFEGLLALLVASRYPETQAVPVKGMVEKTLPASAPAPQFRFCLF
jgi:hypothetical protein